MPSFVDVVNGNSANASDVQQLLDALKGTAGKGIPLSPTAVNDAINFALAVKNNDAGASKALLVLKADGTVLLQADKNGVVVSPDGVLGASQIATLTGTQIFTNKTLTSPHMTGPVVDSGGLQVTSGGVGIGVAPGTQLLKLSGDINTNAGIELVDTHASGGTWDIGEMFAAGSLSIRLINGTTNPEILRTAPGGAAVMNGGFGIGAAPPANGLLIAGNAPGVSASQVGLGSTVSGTATAGSATLPANPVGFWFINVAGTNYKVPYYNT